MRALPIGLILIAWRRRLPHGIWWWRSLLLGVLNFGAFFALMFVAAYRLPGGMAATLTATAPIMLMLLAWAIVGERPKARSLVAAMVGAAGVALLVLRAGFTVDMVGVLASLCAISLSALGYTLVKKWAPPVDLLTFTAWQLVAGGLLLAPAALIVEGGPPSVDPAAVSAFVYLGLIATGLAFTMWFRGLRRMPAAATALIGLLNPVVGTLLGVLFANERFGAAQLAGMTLVLGGVVAGQPAISLRLRRRPQAPGGRPEWSGPLGSLGLRRELVGAPLAAVPANAPYDQRDDHDGRDYARRDRADQPLDHLVRVADQEAEQHRSDAP
jgi:probable blue pigment (indigoidine) exporter